MKIESLKSSDELMIAVKKDLKKANNRLYIQMLCIEGDETGKMFCNELMKCNVKAKIIIDSMVKLVISDKIIYHPKNLKNKELRKEIRDTNLLYSQMQKDGIQLKLGKPLGKLLSNGLARNHTKYIVIDDVVYTGGRNICDHNFAWNDLMLRFESPELADFLDKDFQNSWKDDKKQTSLAIGEKGKRNFFFILNGKTNESIFDVIRAHIKSAKKNILIHSPYISHPFFDTLKEVREKNNVKIDLLSPKNNNHKILNRFTKWECKRIGINLHHFPGMSHLKAMLIDDKTLIVGTSNFDYLSYRHLQELVVIIKDPIFIKKFKAEVLMEDFKKAVLYTKRPHKVTGRICKFALRQSIDLFSSWNKAIA